MSKLSRKTVTVYLQLKLMKMMVECWQHQSKKFIHNANMQTIRKKVLAPYFIFSSLEKMKCSLHPSCLLCLSSIVTQGFYLLLLLFFFPPRIFKCFSFFLSKCFLTGVLFLPLCFLFLTFVLSLHSHEPSAADLWFGLAADHNLSLGWIFFFFGLFIDNLVCL